MPSTNLPNGPRSLCVHCGIWTSCEGIFAWQLLFHVLCIICCVQWLHIDTLEINAFVCMYEVSNEGILCSRNGQTDLRRPPCQFLHWICSLELFLGHLGPLGVQGEPTLREVSLLLIIITTCRAC